MLSMLTWQDDPCPRIQGFHHHRRYDHMYGAPQCMVQRLQIIQGLDEESTIKGHTNAMYADPKDAIKSPLAIVDIPLHTRFDRVVVGKKIYDPISLMGKQ